MAFQSFDLLGNYQLFDGSAAEGVIEIIPSVKVVKDTTGNVILSGRVKVTLEPDVGSFSVSLPDPNDPTLAPSDFGYTVVAKLRHAHLRAISFGPDQVTGPTLDVEDITPVDVSTLTPTVQYPSMAEMAAALADALADASADTEMQVSIAIENLIAGAPGALDTLLEIANQLDDDESAVAAIVTAMATEATARATGDTNTLASAATDATTKANAAQAAAATDATGKVATEATARQAAIATAISNLVAGAPGALDTLLELANQQGTDASAAAALTSLVGNIRDLSDATHNTALSAAIGTAASGAGTSVMTMGAIGDGVADDSTAFSTAAALGIKNVYVPKGTYKLSANVTITSFSTWVMHPSAVLKPSTDHTVLTPAVGSKIHGGQIDCSGLAAYTSPAVLYTGQLSGGSNTVLSGMTIKGKNISGGAAIKLTCPTTGNYIDWVHVENCYLTDFSKLIWLDANVTGTWINANTFTDITLGLAANCLYVDGDGTHTNNADGNIFRFNGQAGAGGSRAIYCTGSDNDFDGFIYDVGGSGLTPVFAEIFPAGIGNKIRTARSYWDGRIIDNGFYTDVQSRMWARHGSQAFEPAAPYSLPATGSVPIGLKYIGNQDDWLAYAHKRHTITQTAGNAITSGSLNNIAIPDPALVATWTQAVAQPDIIFEIDLAAEKVVWPRLMGLVFEYALRPKKIIVQAMDDVLGTVTLFSTTTNDQDVVTLHMNASGLTSVNKLQITLADPKTASPGTIRLTRVWLSSGNQIGKTWLPANGGRLFDATAEPTTNPVGGVSLWSTSGTLRGRTTAGTIRTITGDVTAVAASYTALKTDATILVTTGATARTITLPASVLGARHTIKKVDSGVGTVTIATTSSQTIDGSTTRIIYLQNGAITVEGDGTGWCITGAVGMAIVDTFTASATWTKRAGARSVKAMAIGAGGQGGSARRGAAGTIRCGGGGGGGGAVSEFEFDATLLGSTEAVVVPTGGAAGGAAVTADDTSGNAGSAGSGAATFGSHVSASSGSGGAGGTATTGAGGFNASGRWSSSSGAAASTTGLVGAAPGASNGGAHGGGSGGGVSSANVDAAGGAGGAAIGRSTTAATAGTASGGAGNPGTSAPAGQPQMGGSGSGGGGSSVGAGGAGGAGGTYGAGGGGGGAALNGANSGAGGVGAPGIVVVTTYF